MNTVFNITRFGNLVKKEAVASWRFYLYIILGAIAFFIIAVLLEDRWPILKMLLAPLYVLSVVCVVPMIDRNMSVQNAPFYLSLPVSKFERWFLLWLKSVIVLPLILSALLYIFNELSPILSLNSVNEQSILNDIYPVLAFQSIFFFGFIYSRKRIVPIIALVVFFILIYVISSTVISAFYSDVSSMRSSLDPFYIWNFDTLVLDVNGEYQLVKEETTMLYDIAKYVVMAIFPLGMWVLSYFRLKETEA